MKNKIQYDIFAIILIAMFSVAGWYVFMEIIYYLNDIAYEQLLIYKWPYNN